MTIPHMTPVYAVPEENLVPVSDYPHCRLALRPMGVSKCGEVVSIVTRKVI